MSETGQDRTEAATPRRREEARKQGQTASSADLGTALLLCGMFVLLLNVGPMMGGKLYGLVQQGLTGGIQWRDWSIHEIVVMGRVSASYFMATVAIVVGGGFIAGISASVAQNGFRVTPEALEWKPSRLSPSSGIKKILSYRGLMRTLMAMLKFAVCGGATVFTFYFLWEPNSSGTLIELVASSWYLGLYAGLAGALCLLTLGLGDYLFQRWQFEDELKMTRQQIKDEMKESQGDPAVKGRIRRLQAESAKVRSLAEVPKASVVVTNPTHYAIAIRYDRATMSAPCVIAKGKGALALKIRQRAMESGVPVLERKPLARALYASTEIGSEIPTALYRAVAEILTYVYKLRPTG